MARIRRALRKLLFPNDFAGKALFRTTPGAIELVKAPGVFVRELPSELDEDTVPHYSDILIEFILDTTIRRWAKVAQRAKIALMHIEFVDRLRPGLAVRMLEYALAIKNRYGLHTLARQCIVVVGVVAKEGRLRALDCGLDGEGRTVWIPIFYADEFDFRRLSPREQGLLLIVPNVHYHALNQEGREGYSAASTRVVRSRVRSGVRAEPDGFAGTRTDPETGFHRTQGVN